MTFHDSHVCELGGLGTLRRCLPSSSLPFPPSLPLGIRTVILTDDFLLDEWPVFRMACSSGKQFLLVENSSGRQALS